MKLVARTSTTYVITPAHFGFTTRLNVLVGLCTLACFVLPMLVLLPWTPREIVSAPLTWLFLTFYWYVQHNYSLEAGDDAVRVVDGVVNGRITSKSQSIVWPIVVHAICNGAIFVAVVVVARP